MKPSVIELTEADIHAAIRAYVRDKLQEDEVVGVIRIHYYKDIDDDRMFSKRAIVEINKL
jgi:hypothetical protein